MIRRVLIAAALLVSASTAIHAQAGKEEAERLARFKAVFVMNFAEYVTWPPVAGSDEFVIGVFGESPLRTHLFQATAKRKIAERTVRVQSVADTTADQLAGVHLLVVGKTAVPVSELARHLQDRPILTVADVAGAAQLGSCINFVLIDGRLKFEVNPKAVQRSGLKMSSHLLRLATLVE